MKLACPLLLSLSFLVAPAFAQEAPVAAETATTEASAEAPAAEAADPAAIAATAEAPAAASDAVAAPAIATAVASPVDAKLAQAIGAPSPGKAMVVFFRPGKFMGGGVGFIVREKGVELGKLRNSRYFAIEVEPGQHEYIVHSEAKDVTHLEAEAGETYFLAGTMTMGVLVYHPNLSPSDAGAFSVALPKLKKAKPLD